jgi:hypothetical protein
MDATIDHGRIIAERSELHYRMYHPLFAMYVNEMGRMRARKQARSETNKRKQITWSDKHEISR